MVKLKENSQICRQWCVCGGKEQELKIKGKEDALSMRYSIDEVGRQRMEPKREQDPNNIISQFYHQYDYEVYENVDALHFLVCWMIVINGK